MERVNNAKGQFLLTPTAQYAGGFQGNDDAMTAPGSPNRFDIQAMNVPMDVQPTDASHGGDIERNNQQERVRDNPDIPEQATSTAPPWVNVSGSGAPKHWDAGPDGSGGGSMSGAAPHPDARK